MAFNVTRLRETMREAEQFAKTAASAFARAAEAADKGTLVEVAEAADQGAAALLTARGAAREALGSAVAEARAEELLAGLGFSETAVSLLSPAELARLVAKAKEIALGAEAGS